MALPLEDPESGHSDAPHLEEITQATSEPLMKEMLDAATAVLAASSHCRDLEKIISEAVQANGAFERMAKVIENAGYELRICLDLSAYAHVHPRETAPEETSVCYARVPRRTEPSLAESAEGVFLPLSDPDTQFLKKMRISLE